VVKLGWRREKGEGRREKGVLADCDVGRAGADVECSKMGAGRMNVLDRRVKRVRDQEIIKI